MADKQSNNSALDREGKPFSILASIEDEIRDRAKEDPFARFLLEGWKQVLIVAIAVLAVVYIRNAYIKNQEANQEYAADRFAQVRGGFQELRRMGTEEEEAKNQNKQAEAGKEETSSSERAVAVKKLSEAIRALEEVKEPYTDLGPLYKMLLQIEENTEPSLLLTMKESEALPAKEDTLSRMTAELQLLSFARAKLSSSGSSQEAKATLKRLINEAEFAQVSAAVSLARVASTPEEKHDAAALLRELRDREPEQAKLLDPELKRLSGLSSES